MTVTVQQARWPIAWLVLISVFASILVSCVGAITQASQLGSVALGGAAISALSGSWGVLGGVQGLWLLAAAVAVQIEPRPAGARTLTRVAAIGATAALLARLVFFGIGLPIVAQTMTGAALAVALVDAVAQTLLVVGVVWALWALTARPAEPGEAQPAVPEEETPALPAESAENQPTWAPDQASGAVWKTAGEAATGQAAAAWGEPGTRGGWLPAGERPAPSGGEPAAAAESPHRPDPGPGHQPRPVEDFGPSEVARRYARPDSPAPASSQESRAGQGPDSGRRQPPVWAPLPPQAEGRSPGE